MKKTVKLSVLLLLVLLLFTACNSNDESKLNTREDLFQFKGSMIGDNSAVVNIIGELRHGKAFDKVSLETKKEPYGMTLNYDELDGEMVEKENRETILYNTTFLFALIDNAEWATYNFEKQTYTLTKDELEAWYDKDLGAFTTEEELDKFIVEHLENTDSVNHFFDDQE